MNKTALWLLVIGVLSLIVALSCVNHRDRLCGQKWPGSHYRQGSDGQMHCVDEGKNPLGRP